MKAEELLRDYERVADAPDAIERLRRFVLDLAVRGKLVPQNARHTPAAALLAQARSERRRFTEKGKAQGADGRDERTEHDAPFPLPSGWDWVFLSDLSPEFQNGASSRGDAGGTSVTVLRLADIANRRVSLANTRQLPILAAAVAKYSLVQGDILITRVNGSADIVGQFNLCDRPIDAIYCDHFIRMRVRGDWLDPMFCALLGDSDLIRQSVRNLFVTTAGQKTVNQGHIGSLHFALPPVEEQRRIVAKVDELMALCDRLAAARAEREAARDRLAGASLARLNAPDPETFADDARFALDALPALTARPDQIKLFRQAVLNLSLRGKLAESQPSDGSGRDVLAQIDAEREVLVRNCLIRREAPLESVHPKEMPFELPPGWEWVRVGNAVLFTQYGTSQKSAVTDAGVPVLTMGNIQDGAVIPESSKRIAEDSGELPALYLKKFDLLYNRTNSAELVGKTGIYLGEDGTTTFASYLIRLRPSLDATDPRFLNLAMNSTDFRATQIMPLIKKQTGQANVNGSALKNMLIPMPPLAAQIRIVKKVDELMSLCDQLEISLRAGSESRIRLLETLLRAALEPADALEEAA
ncbi:MAG: restriction endonuclease subunit S [Rubrivivax sp.]